MHYVVDGSNRVIDVDGGWDASAAQVDGGSGAMRAQIIGRPLEQFMVGDATKMFVRAALDAARLLNETRVLPYRCDSPDERRRFEMVVSPLADGRVQVEHRLLSAEKRQLRPAVARMTVPAGWRCSQCLQVRLAGSPQWQEAEGYTPLAQDICPACAHRLFDSPMAPQNQSHD